MTGQRRTRRNRGPQRPERPRQPAWIVALVLVAVIMLSCVFLQLMSLIGDLAGIDTAPVMAPETPAVTGQPNRYSHLPECQHEDGNPDGKPCLWTDPDSHDIYYVTSLEYRR